MFSKDFDNAVQVLSIADSAGNDILMAEMSGQPSKNSIVLNNVTITGKEVLNVLDSYGSDINEILRTLIEKNQIVDFYLEGIIEFAIEIKLPIEYFGLKGNSTVRALLSVFETDEDKYYHIHLFNKVLSEYRSGKFQIEIKQR